MNPNKLFFSIDGVLSNRDHMKANWDLHAGGDFSVFIMPEKVRLFNQIRAALPGFELITHSHWDKSIGRAATTDALTHHGIESFGFTPKKLTSNKIHEVQFALEDHPGPHRILVLDSEDFGSRHLKDRYADVLYIETDRTVGLTENHVQEVMRWNKS